MALPLTLASMITEAWEKNDQDWQAQATPTQAFFKNKWIRLEGGEIPAIPVNKTLIQYDNPPAKGQLSTAHFETRTKITASSTGHYHWPISVDLEEKMRTRNSPYAYARMVADKTKNAHEAYKIAINTDLFNGVAFSSFYSSRRIVGLKATLTNYTSTYFNVPGSTANFQPVVDSTTTMAGSISSAHNDMVADILARRGRPDYSPCSAAVWKQLARENAGRERVMVGEKDGYTAKFGIEAIMSAGVPIVLEPAAASSAPYDLLVIDSRSWYPEYDVPSEGSADGILWTRDEAMPTDSYVGTTHKSCWVIVRCGSMRVNGYFSALS